MGCCSNEKSCNCACHSQCKSCCCPCHAKHDQCDEECSSESKTNYFLEIADEAWEEVLKDKIKDHILKTQNERMNKLAKIVAEGNNQRWKNKMEKRHGYMEFQEELCEFFSQTKK